MEKCYNCRRGIVDPPGNLCPECKKLFDNSARQGAQYSGQQRIILESQKIEPKR